MTSSGPQDLISRVAHEYVPVELHTRRQQVSWHENASNGHARPGADDVLSSRAMVSLRRFAAGVILTICIGAPILEMFDRWDRTLEDGNDTEINLVVVALCVGVSFSVAGALVARL